MMFIFLTAKDAKCANLLHRRLRRSGRKTWVVEDPVPRVGAHSAFEPRKGTEYTEVFPGGACLSYLVFLTTIAFGGGGWSLSPFSSVSPWRAGKPYPVLRSLWRLRWWCLWCWRSPTRGCLFCNSAAHGTSSKTTLTK